MIITQITGIVLLELAALVLIVLGFIYENKLIKLEDQIIKKILAVLHK